MYTIALVDDEKYSLSDIRHTFPLKAYGFNLVAALTDPMQALSLLPSLKPDVVFVDIRMPELSGLELIRRLKPSLPDSVYVILSGYSEFEYAQSAIRLDVFEYFLKPYDEEDAEELLERLSLHLSKRHAPQESAQEAPSLHSNQQFNRLLQHVDQHVYEPLNLGTAGLRVLSQRQLLQPAVQIRHGQDLFQLRARQAHRAGQGAVGRFGHVRHGCGRGRGV